ncbi:hypothetical protein CASFOL_010396 [Castilleja foliolosa]|uniref:Uncharacterized protein n=1 Tax=Castilleja foliolosa TaxID=1961234 RepID=A0ABD3DSG9_9LAMI
MTTEADVTSVFDGMMSMNMVINIRNFRNPYRRTEVDDIENGFRKILVCFDVKKQVFRNVPFPRIKRGEEGIFVDWNGLLPFCLLLWRMKGLNLLMLGCLMTLSRFRERNTLLMLCFLPLFVCN